MRAKGEGEITMKKRTCTMIFALMMAAGVIAGCGPKNAETTGNQENKENKQAETDDKQAVANTADTGKQNLTFWIRGAETDAICQSLQSDIDKYNASEDGIGHVTIEYVPITDFVAKFNTAFAGGTAPDLVDTGVDQISIRAHMGHYLALDEYMDSWENKGEIVESYLAAGKMEDDGKTYGLGYAPTPCVFVWRKDFFEEAGLDPEKPPKDWEEMLEYAKKLVVKNGDTVVRGGFSLEPADFRLYTLMARQAGSTLYDPQTNMPQLADEAGISALKYFADIQPYSILYNPAPGAKAMRSFMTSESAMAYITTEELSAMINNDPSLDDKIGVAAYIPNAGGADSTWCGYRLFAINADSKAKDASWDAIRFLMTEDSNRNRLKNANVPPAWEKLMEEYKNVNPKVNEPAIKAISVGEPFPKTDWMASYGEAVRNAQQEVMYGQKAPEDAMKDAENLIKTDAGLN